MISLDRLEFVGSGLRRPECVLAAGNGALLAADWRGGVTRIAPDGSQTSFLAPEGTDLLPNGIALRRDGSFLVTHLGAEEGGVFHLTRAGELRPAVLEIEGERLPPTNYVLEEPGGRLWITVSTRRIPRALGYRADQDDGFIVVADERGVRIAAEGLGYANECQIHPGGAWLYLNETFQRRLSRFPLGEEGALGPRETVAEFGEGTFPDGLVFDVEGAVWITSIVSNRVIRVAPDGTQETILEDADPAHLAWVEEAYRKGELGRPHLDGIKSVCLKNVSSLAFGGHDLKTAYLGCLLGDAIACFRSPIPGLTPFHWNYPA